MNEIIRQTEIVASVLNKEGKGISDFAEIYDVSEITIHRDLGSLRKLGIAIFSRRKRLEIMEKIPNNVLNGLLAEYLPLKLNREIYLKKLEVYSKKIDTGHFQIITTVTKAISEKRIFKMEYKRIRDDEAGEYFIQPIKILNNEFNWILHGIKRGETILKTFYLSRIRKLVITENTFEIKEPIEIKEKREKILLRFSPIVINEISHKIWFDDFQIEKREDGFIYLETQQTVSLKLASWCVSWCDKLKIIEPESLKKLIRDMTEGFRQNNEI
ncbi:MAG TPA: WYL domain-containing transcriptional regulator [Ignavibacteriaceae bacterium]|nr:WYL domain-containing transcriptional regulator [Ignavibacteriaceae bacterium]